MYIEQVNSPLDLKRLEIAELSKYCKEVRNLIVNVVSQNGGHLSSNLGIVELTCALHYVFRSPVDKIIFDVGHQCYAHKIITGRASRFHTLRQFEGISGFPNKDESPHDVFTSGHASTSISTALGIAEAKKQNKEDGRVIAVIGDGAMTGGLAFEGLNQAGHLKSNLIVILNDNNMSISKNVGALASYLSRKTATTAINRLRTEFKNFLRTIPAYGENIFSAVKKLKGLVKGLLSSGIVFECLGYRYIGPICGNDLDLLIKTLKNIREIEGPILLHINTRKGNGYPYAMESPSLFHGVGPFDKTNGVVRGNGNKMTFSDVFGKTLCELAKRDKKIVAITAAMKDGTSLSEFAEKFPDRFYDVGIAEEHAVAFAAGLAKQGLKPVVAIYSTFLQRAYDQLFHDVGIQNLPVIFAIDRAGLVGEDGITHHGLLDISYLRNLPNLTLFAPKDENELRDLLYSATFMNGPVAIRYPRGCGVGLIKEKGYNFIDKGVGEVLAVNLREQNILLLGVGTHIYTMLNITNKLDELNLGYIVINPCSIKPLDEGLILKYAFQSKLIVTLEENVIDGGFGTAILELLSRKKISKDIITIGFPNPKIEHGARNIILKKYGLTEDAILDHILERFPIPLWTERKRAIRPITGKSVQ